MNNGFSLTTLFVAPSGTLATSGSTSDLTAGQLGLFRPDYSIATAGNIAAAKYIYIAQGRIEAVPTLGSKRSDKIASDRVISWYKTVGESTARLQISQTALDNVKCDDIVIITYRLYSPDLDVAFYNGYTKSVTVQAPCCDCGEDPCEEIDGTALQAMVDEAVDKLNATSTDQWNGSDVRLSDFITFSRVGTGADSVIYAAAKADVAPSSAGSDLSRNVYQPRRLWFKTFVTRGTDTTVDFYVDDRCEQIGTTTVTQTATFPSGSSEEVKLLERRYYSYQTSHFKTLHRNADWNMAFESYVVDGTFYDLYYIRFIPVDNPRSWSDTVSEDSTVIVAFEAGEGTAFETAMTAKFGAPENKSAVDVVTTTTTTTSTTTTTTTTE